MNALLAAQLPNGGWFWAFIKPGQIDPGKDQSDVDATGRVLQLIAEPLSLECLTATYGQPRPISQAGNWPVAARVSAGQMPENANSTGLVIAGLQGPATILTLRRFGPAP